MIIHTVSPGETLNSIAMRYGASPSRISEDNRIGPEARLVPGQALLILQPNSFYTVVEGDTLSLIAEKTGLSEKALLRFNPALIGTEALYPGQALVLSDLSKGTTPLVTGGYAYPFIERETLDAALPYLTNLVVFTYGFDRAGNLLPPAVDDRPVLDRARAAGTSPVLLLSTLGPDDLFDNTLTTSLFASPEAQERLISQLLAVMREKGYEGLEIDFEYIEPSERQAFVDFISQTRARMNAAGYEVMVALAPKTYAAQPGLLYEAHDYAALGNVADAVLLMAYEWGYSMGPPQAVAPLDKVRAVVDYALSEISADKIFLGIPNYGYDWTLPYTPGTSARSLSPDEALRLAAATGSEILYDERAQSPYFFYTDDAGNAHVVWFEDARSHAAKLDLIAEKGLAGYSVWTVMRPARALFYESNVKFDVVD